MSSARAPCSPAATAARRPCRPGGRPPPGRPHGPHRLRRTDVPRPREHHPAATTSATPALLSTPGPDLASGPATTPAVALTFHGAGDVALAHQVLTLLQQRGAKVTVFAVGTWLSATPSVGRDIVAEGHALGNHTWSHPTLTHLALAPPRPTRCGAAPTRWPRRSGTRGCSSAPPAPRRARRRSAPPRRGGYARSISYDLDSLDYTDPGADAVVRTVDAGCTPARSSACTSATRGR